MALNSMTGFASIGGETGDSVWRWDLKSVNGRGLDLRFRLPAGTEMLEPRLRELLRAVLARGSVSIALSSEKQKAGSAAYLDGSTLEVLVAGIVAIRNRLEEAGVPVAPSRPEALLGLAAAGESSAAGDTPTEAEVTILLDGFSTALAALLEARRAEGDRLERVISEQVTQIASLAAAAADRADAATDVLRDRLREQVSTLAADIALAPERLEQEIAVLATKADIREEIDRLNAHVAAARELLEQGGPVGRRLDFLTQEFNREANTLCSKAPTDELTRIGLDLKSAIDRLREQAANIE